MQNKIVIAICIFVCLAACVICPLVFSPDDNPFDGWIPHTENVDLYMQGEWLDGETRVCMGVQTYLPLDHPLGIKALYCPSDYEGKTPHNVPVKFWGKTLRHDVTLLDEQLVDKGLLHKFEWRCVRSDRFTCWPLN
jgi:hypothetical protein